MVRGVLARIRRRDDAGFTLMDTIVGMAVMTIFLGMFTGAVFEMFHTADKSQSLAQANTQVNQAFERLDTLARYAAYVSTPGANAAGTAWYVEIGDSLQPVDSSNKPTTCYQLRLDTASHQLQMRTWTTGNPTAWKQIASNIVNQGQPFSYVAPVQNGPVVNGALTIDLIASAGGGDRGATTNSKMTFTAMNTYPGTPLTGPDYCSFNGWRP